MATVNSQRAERKLLIGSLDDNMKRKKELYLEEKKEAHLKQMDADKDKELEKLENSEERDKCLADWDKKKATYSEEFPNKRSELLKDFEIDLQKVFEMTMRNVYVESMRGQISIEASTLLKRLCFPCKEITQPSDS